MAGALVGGAGAAVGPLELISRGAPASDAVGSDVYAVSADGRYVVFTSEAANLVPDQVDPGGTTDIFLHDRGTGITTLVSRRAGSSGTAGNGDSFQPAISANGRYVAFASTATDLVAGLVSAGPGNSQIFLFDREAGVTSLVSRTPGSPVTTGNDSSVEPAISADGGFVVFLSGATDLVPGQVDANGSRDVFLHDRTAGTTILVSQIPASAVTTANDRSSDAVLSDDGRLVAFVSLATDLVAGQLDADETQDVFLYDRVTQTTVLVSGTAAASATAGNGPSHSPAISGDGAFVAFLSEATNLSPAQVEPFPSSTDVFLYQRSAQTTTLVTHTHISPITADGLESSSPRISADGAFVVYTSLGQSLTSSGTPGDDGTNVFLYDRAADTNALLSPTPTARGFSDSATISADGRFVAFRSVTPDLVPGQIDSVAPSFDVFLYSRLAATTKLVSHTAGSALTAANGPSSTPILSADGRFVVFESMASDLVEGVVDLNGSFDLFLYDDLGGSTLLSRRDPGATGDTAAAWSELGRHPVSADGRFVAFINRAANLVPGQVDLNHFTDVFLRDLLTSSTTLVSRIPASAVTAANGESQDPVVSADGRFVAFVSSATDLVAGQVDVNEGPDVFLFDRLTGVMRLVSHRPTSTVTAGSQPSGVPVLSADGRFVAFQSSAPDLVQNQLDGNGDLDIFLYDRDSETTVLVSRTALSTVTTGNGLSESPVISADGRFVAFRSLAPDLVAGQVDPVGAFDVFLYERETGSTTLVSRTPASAVTAANSDSAAVAISADGGLVLLESLATDLVAEQPPTGGGRNVFLHDRVTGATTLVSRPRESAPDSFASSHVPVISADGRFVAFTSVTQDLVPGQQDNNGTLDVFLYDREAGTMLLASRSLLTRAAASAAVTGNGRSQAPALSADGRVLIFLSLASDLTGDADLNGQDDVFVLARACPGGLGRGPAPPCPGAAVRPAP